MVKTSAPIRVGIVDDETAIRDWVRGVVQGNKGFRLVAEFESGEDAVEAATDIDADVLLLDIQLDGMNGVSCLRKLRPLLPKTKIAIFTAFPDEEPIFQSLRAGADGYLIKNMPPRRLLDAIAELHLGGSPVTPSIARRILEFFRTQANDPSPLDALSPRERDIVEQMAKGLTYKEIAAVLGISIETVRTHIHNVYKKLRVKSGTEAVMKLFGRESTPFIPKASTSSARRK